jgi:toluene monooxygenase electron transfer component
MSSADRPDFKVSCANGATFACAADEIPLFAARKAGLDLPYEGASGSCGACVCGVGRGAAVHQWPEAPGLSARDRASGDRILACQATPTSDIGLKSRCLPAQNGVTAARWFAETVAKERLTDEVMPLVLAAPGATFLPGQFAILRLPESRGRGAFSMANLSNALGRLEFLIKRKPGGAGTPYLFDELRLGQGLEIE